MKKLISFFISTSLSASMFSQSLHSPIDIQPDAEYENVHVKEIYSDSLNSTYIIWVKKEVKAHRHAFHTESIYVIAGSGEMQNGEVTFSIVAGDFFIIPKNTVHSVVVTSQEPLKIISIQSPKFDGKDRIWVE